jgi:DamX protein
MVDSLSQGLVAPLKSQQQLVDRLLTQIRFSSRLLLITGEAGSGKSTLANCLLERSDFANQALVVVKTEGDETGFRQALLEQLIREPLFNRHDRISDSLFRNLEHSLSPQLIVVDNAHRLTPELLGELQELVRIYPEHYEHTLCVLMFGQPSQELRNLATRWDPEYAIQVVVPALSRSESFALADRLFKRANYQPQVINSAAIDKQIESAQGNPGKIYHVVDHIVTGAAEMSGSEPSRRSYVWVVLLVVLVMAVAGILYQTVSEWNSSESLDPTELVRVPVVLPTQKDKAVLGEAQGPDFVRPKVEPEEEAGALPPAINGAPVSLQSASGANEQRVVVDSDVVNRLMASQENSGQDALDETTQRKIESAATSNPLVVQTNPIVTSNAFAVEPSPKSATPVTLVSTPVTKELMAKNPEHFTLQLGAFSSQASAERYVTVNGPEGSVWIYSFNGASKALHKVIYGDYASREAAKVFQDKLKAQGQDSLLKTFQQVQFELR